MFWASSCLKLIKDMKKKCSFIEDGMPNVDVLCDELQRTISNASVYFSRMERSADTRYCVWPGQSHDGRKHKGRYGKDPFPWDGATDTRIPLADEIINEQVMVLLAAFFRPMVQAVGVEAGDQMRSQKITTLMKWMVYGKMLPHLYREVQLAAQWRQDPGLAIMSIEWEQETRVDMEYLDIEALQTMANQAGSDQDKQLLVDIAEKFFDPLREAEAVEELQALSPLIKGSVLRRVLREIRSQGHTEYPVPSIVTNRPRWKALRPFVDVFFPTETDDLQSARYVCRPEYVTESELRDRIVTQGYDEDFMDEALKHKGKRFQTTDWSHKYYDGGFNGYGILGSALDEQRDYIELFHFYYKDSDEYGQPALYYTVMNDAVSKASRGELIALHQPHGYDHGQYPFVPLVREHHTRRLADSRGVSSIAATWQDEIKIQRDSRADYTQIATIPPLVVPPTRGTVTFGPGVQWPGRRGMNPEFLNVPPFNQGSIEMERATMAMADRYFGRMSENVSPALQQLHQQHLVNGWMIEMRLCMGQTFELMQQFMEDVEVQRIVGVVDTPFHVSREEIQGKYDFYIDFDVRNLDMEFVKEKLKAIQEIVLPFDRFGTFDMANLAQFALRSLDPSLADMVTTTPQAASEREVEDEKQALAQMVAGIEPPMKLGNMNWKLRLDTLRNSVMANPELQQMVRSRPLLADMLEQRVKYLSQQIMQEQNAVTGRLGAQPVLGGV